MKASTKGWIAAGVVGWLAFAAWQTARKWKELKKSSARGPSYGYADTKADPLYYLRPNP